MKPNETFYPENATRFGRSRGGNDLVEHQWGNHEKSILFLTGFTEEDSPISDLLLRWERDLFEAERYGGILGDFDLKTLKNKCKIRMIPILNPDSYKINQNGLSKNFEKTENSLKSKDSYPIKPEIQKKTFIVDLNRNFNANWIKMRQKDPQNHRFGAFPESEPEVAFLTARLKEDLPKSAVILRQGEKALFHPSEATEKELREAVFLGHYASLSVTLASDTDGTPLQWLTDRGVKVIEAHLPPSTPNQYPKWRNFLTMCTALT